MATCAICKYALNVGGINPTFAAECLHSFHYYCITEYVQRGNKNCPSCGVELKNIPSPFRVPPPSPFRSIPWGVPPPPPSYSPFMHVPPPFLSPSEPLVFNDDDPIVLESKLSSNNISTVRSVDINTHTEFPAVSRSTSKEDFHILVNLKSHVTDIDQASITSRAPIDLVTVLDVSYSMIGEKIRLLQQAMRFVINNLGPSDRLSVVSFSTHARRILPLVLMTDSGKQRALQAVNSLVVDCETNILEGLEKGTKVIEDRKHKNPVHSIMLLSDGQDTCTKVKSINVKEISKLQIPVHTFGFGTDHDPIMMHSIAESSKGSFSFIEAEGFIQDAFAQRIGGLLSVAVQDLQVHVQSLDPCLCLGQLKAGSYSTDLTGDNQTGSVNIGDMYADEERDFLVLVKIPVVADGSINDPMKLVSVWCSYKNPFSKESVTTEAIEVKLPRPETVTNEDMVVSIEVDRQKNRLQAAEAMKISHAVAESGDLRKAQSIIDGFRMNMLQTPSMHAQDSLSTNLDSDLQELSSRMGNRQAYQSSGRAFALAGMSSHSRQQATTRTPSLSMCAGSSYAGAPVQAACYQTPAMDRMVNRSRASRPQPPPAGNPRQK